MTTRKSKKNEGQVMLTAVMFFVFISVTIVFGMTIPILKQVKISQENYKSKQSFYLALAGMEDVLYRIKNGDQYSASEVLSLNGEYATTTTSDISGGKEVTTSAEVNKNLRKLKVGLVLGAGASFHYGIQSGQGGFVLQNSSSVVGNVYSNGSITGAGNTIYGNVVSAGPSGLVDGIHATGTAYAHTINDSDVDKDAYYTTITSSTVLGNSYPGSPDQATTSMPITDAMIEDFKTEAEGGGSVTCTSGLYSISSNTTIGPKKIPCDLEIKGVGTIVTLTGPIWVEGNFETKNTPTIKVDPSFGTMSLPIVTHKPSNSTGSGIITLQNNTTFQGSGSPTSFVFLISMNNSAETGGSTNAIVQSQGSGAMVLYAPHGQVTLQQSVNLKEVTAYKIIMQNTAQVRYDTGLPSTLFDSGPSGGFELTSWQEVQ
jgi:hypothetical protein